MAEPAGKTIKYLLVLSVFLFLYSCANQLPPGGGEIDKIPPVITEIYPADGTTNFKDDYFELNFSEYVEKRSVKDAIFISPAVEGNIKLDWSGKSVTVNFPSPLRPNTTYNITIGTDVADFNNKNKMAEPYNFSFSTGPNLDRRVITGKVFSDKPQGVFLYAYLNPKDTLDPSRSKPDYISQSGIDGNYRLPGLAAGKYRIFAVLDEFRDLLYQADQDKIGVPFREVDLAESDSLFTGLNFFLNSVDTVKPRLMTSVMTDINHAVLTFSEELDHRSVSSKNFSFIDSTTMKSFRPLYAYKNMNKPAEVILAFKDAITENSQILLRADTIMDKAGNKFLSEVNPVTVSVKQDTIKPFIAKMNPASGSQTADFQNQVFSFAFNDGVDSGLVKNNISFTDTSKRKIKFSISFPDDASFNIIPAEHLEPAKNYIISFNLKGITDAAGNRSDTTIQYRFKTITGLDFTGATGSLVNIDLQRNPVLMLQGINEKKITYQKNVKSASFSFERVEPGTYRLWTFYDRDSNNVYSYGWHYPYKPSEEFTFYKDSLVLRPRWAVSDIIFDLKK